MNIPGYRLSSRCGEGAFGEVRIATDSAGFRSAIKILRSSKPTEREFSGLQNYSKIHDFTNLVRVLHTGRIGDTLYYTMELADNLGTEENEFIPATLGNLLAREKRFSPEKTIALALELLNGLEALASAGLAHRDIKPENIIYVNGIPKLSDIGLVRPADGTTRSIAGTIGFLPPEYLRGETSGKDPAGDLYSLGKVLYCCLTGNPAEKYPSFPPELMNDPEAKKLNRVLCSICAPDPKHRMNRIPEIRAALKEGVPTKRKITDFFRKSFRTVPILLLLLCLSLVLLPLAFLRTQTEGEDRPDEIADTNSEQTDPAFQALSPLILDSPPRRKDPISTNEFNEPFWKTDGPSNGIVQTEKGLLATSGAHGTLQFRRLLSFPYAASFTLDAGRTDASATVQVTAEDGSFYAWTFSVKEERLLPEHLVYRNAKTNRTISLKPIGKAEPDNGRCRFDMIRTTKTFRVLINGEPVFFSPGFFHGGRLSVTVRTDDKGKENHLILKDFSLYKIPHVRVCPPEKEYHLPLRKNAGAGTF